MARLQLTVPTKRDWTRLDCYLAVREQELGPMEIATLGASSMACRMVRRTGMT